MKRSLDYPIPGCSLLPFCLYLSLFHFFGHACTFFLPRSGREKCRETFSSTRRRTFVVSRSSYAAKHAPINLALQQVEELFLPTLFFLPLPPLLKVLFFFLFLIRVKSFNVRKGKSLSRLPKV